jgi:hypothetical protein
LLIVSIFCLSSISQKGIFFNRFAMFIIKSEEWGKLSPYPSPTPLLFLLLLYISIPFSQNFFSFFACFRSF